MNQNNSALILALMVNPFPPLPAIVKFPQNMKTFIVSQCACFVENCLAPRTGELFLTVLVISVQYFNVQYKLTFLPSSYHDYKNIQLCYPINRTHFQDRNLKHVLFLGGSKKIWATNLLINTFLCTNDRLEKTASASPPNRLFIRRHHCSYSHTVIPSVSICGTNIRMPVHDR